MITGTTWGCDGVASKTSTVVEEEIKLNRRTAETRFTRVSCALGGQEDTVSADACAVGDVRLAVASRLG